MPGSTAFKLGRKKLNENADAPLYRQIYDIFQQQIVSGRVAKNAHLPSEQEIIEALGVSRITVRRALNELAASGLVKRQRGRGTVVTFNAAAPMVKASFENLIAGLTRMGVETEVRLIDCKMIKPPRALASMMELPAGEKVQRIVRLRTLQGEPFSYLITHVPEYVAQSYNSKALASASLIELLDAAGHRPSAAAQTITAVSADEDIANALQIGVGLPLLRIHRLMRDKDDNVVQEITAHYRADRFQYQMSLARQGDADWTADE